MATVPADSKSLHLTVITPARAVLDTDAAAIVVPGFDGEMGVLPGHAAMLALLGTGEMRVTGAGGQVQKLAVRGGFLQIKNNNVTVLTPESLSSAEIAPADVEAESQKIAAEHPVKAAEREALDGRLRWVRARQKVLQKQG